VLLLLSEDDKNEVHRRVARYRRALGEITPPEGHVPWIRAYAVPSRDYTLVQFDRNGNPQRTPFYDQVEAWIKEMPPGPRLLVADPLTSVFGGNENDRAQASGFIRVDLRRWCRLHRLTQMLLAHPSRAGVSTGDMLSGSTAWENSVRTRLVLMQHKEIPGARKLVRIKSNYSLAGESLTLD
jgi:RecA-family ATPase